MPNFLSPTAADSRSGAPTTVKRNNKTPLTDRRQARTPFPVSPQQNILSLFSPITRDRFSYNAYQKFLVSAYFFSECSRAIAVKKGEAEADGHQAQLEADVNKYLNAKNEEEVARMKVIYEEHRDEIERIRYWLLQLADDPSDELLDLIAEGFQISRISFQGEGFTLSDLINNFVLQVGNQLHSFDAALRAKVFTKSASTYVDKDGKEVLADEGKERSCRASAEHVLIQVVRRLLLEKKLVTENKVSWCRSPIIWAVGLAILAFALGASVHFMPVLGSALAITLATQTLSLVVNILVPAVALSLTAAVPSLIYLRCAKSPVGDLPKTVTHVRVDSVDVNQGDFGKTLDFSGADGV